MEFPRFNADATEIIDFLTNYNFLIHNTILEGGDYYSLIDELIDANMEKNNNGFYDAMEALHMSKVRIYADKRDVTHEAYHVYKEMSDEVSVDLGNLMVQAEEAEQENQQDILSYIEDEDGYLASRPIIGTAVQHRLMLDKIFDFPINVGNPVKGTIQDIKNHIRNMENTYLKTTSAIYLPLDVLTTAERNILRISTNIEEVEFLIAKIFANWDKRKHGVKDSVASARLETSQSQYTINRHLEALGIYRKQYYRFVKEQTLPTKKLVFGMALYFAPNFFYSIEQFMNAFGYSLNSNIMAVSEENIATTTNVVLLDRDIRKILMSGLDTDIILMLLSEKSRKVKKSASSKFS